MCVARGALAKGGEFGILEGRTAALVHPAVMVFLFGATGYAGYLGWQWRRLREVGNELSELKAQMPAAPAEGEAAPREEVVPAGTAEAETGGIVLEEGPALTNEALRDWVKRWCSGDREGLPPISTWNTST